MQIFGLQISRAKRQEKALNSISTGYGRGWYRVLESFAGAWQQNVVVDRDTVLSYSAVFACTTLIAQDIGKLRIKAVEYDKKSRIWREVFDSGYEELLRKPNTYQNRIKFLESWITAKLLHGNAYALKYRKKGKIVRLYLLDPSRVTPLVSTEGEVYYHLKTDNLSNLDKEVVVPASEIIHDPMVTLFHPLVGVSPIYACGLAATQGINIQRNAAKFFGNQSQPGGILVAPGEISPDTAAQLKEYWNENFTGDNAGKIAVVGDGLKYEALTMKASDAQLVAQLQMSAETVCSCFHVPPFMIGVGPMPALNNVETLTQQYYNQCLQSLIESFELSMDEGLELNKDPGRMLGTELELSGLFRMDTLNRYETYSKAIGAGWMEPNAARRGEDMEPVEGGDTPYLQQQNYSLAALNKRDQNDPFAKPTAPESTPPEEEPEDEEDPPDDEETAKSFEAHLSKALWNLREGVGA